MTGFCRCCQWDAEAEAQYAHERKVALLDALEAQWRAEHEAADAGYYATSYSSWLSYGTGLLANIVENLQVLARNLTIQSRQITFTLEFNCENNFGPD